MSLATRALFAAVICLWSGAALAQAPSGALSGTLVDPNDRVVTGLDVQVLLKNVADGRTFSGKVERTGAFVVTGLPAGTYDIDVPIPCCMYTRYQQQAVAIAAGQTLKTELRIGWGMNLGTIGDDPVMLGADMVAKTRNPDAPAPRAANGKPDLTGVWAVIADTAPRPRIPMKPWAAEIQQQLQKTTADQNPGAYCLPQSASMTTVSFPYEFIQTPTRIVQIAEFVTPAHREIYMDGRKHPGPDAWNPAWYGHSIGRWDGDTLVIDTVGFNEITPGFGVHSEQLHIVERIRRVAYGRLEIEITAEDPEAWTAPYTLKLKAGLAEGEDILEYVCAENNKDPQHFGGLGWKGRP